MGKQGTPEIGARLRSSTGEVISTDWIHQPIPVKQAVIVPPDATVAADLPLPALPPGAYTGEIQMVSEGVAWFGTSASLGVLSGPGASSG